jgi:hypothetical protein
MENVLRVGPGQEQRDGSSPEAVFVAALNRADPERVIGLKVRAERLATSLTTWASQFLAAAEGAASRYLGRAASDAVVEPGVYLEHLRTVRDDLAAAKARAKWGSVEYDQAKAAVDEHARFVDVFERAYKEKVDQRAKVVARKRELALRYLRVVARCRALIDAAPKALWVSIEVIWNRGLREDRDATPGARFLIDPNPPPDNAEGDPGPAWKIG